MRPFAPLLHAPPLCAQLHRRQDQAHGSLQGADASVELAFEILREPHQRSQQAVQRSLVLATEPGLEQEHSREPRFLDETRLDLRARAPRAQIDCDQPRERVRRALERVELRLEVQQLHRRELEAQSRRRDHGFERARTPLRIVVGQHRA
jgi:hypothetical protein